MYMPQKLNQHLAPKLLLLLSCACFVLNLPTGIATAQEKKMPPTSSDTIVGQATPANQPKKKRPRAKFFEEERRTRQFGAGSFVRSALDGSQNFFPNADKAPGAESIFNTGQTASADPGKVSEFHSNPLFERPGDIEGLLTVESTDDDNENFLVTTFTSADGQELTLSNIQQNSDVRTGTLTIDGTVTVNGREVNFSNTRAEYNLGVSNKNDTASALILVTDPNDPEKSVFIQIPARNISDYDETETIESIPAGISVGLPTDR